MQTFPDGISERHDKSGIWGRHASPISVIVLGGLLATALAGVMGGQPSPVLSADFDAARMSIRMPVTLRNGEIFEMGITIEARTDIEEATLAVEPSLWNNITVNTTLPAASDETYGAGGIRLSYGEIKAGEKKFVKIDGQINPPMFRGTRGSIALYDRDRLIGAVPVAIKVFP